MACWLWEKIQALETKFLRKLFRISSKTNDWVRSKINFLVGPQEPRLATVKRRKLAWSAYVTWHKASPKPFCRTPWRGGRRRGRQRKMLAGQHERVNAPAYARTVTTASRRRKNNWKRIIRHVSRLPSVSRDFTEVNYTQFTARTMVRTTNQPSRQTTSSSCLPSSLCAR